MHACKHSSPLPTCESAASPVRAEVHVRLLFIPPLPLCVMCTASEIYRSVNKTIKQQFSLPLPHCTAGAGAKERKRERGNQMGERERDSVRREEMDGGGGGWGGSERAKTGDGGM